MSDKCSEMAEPRDGQNHRVPTVPEDTYLRSGHTVHQASYGANVRIHVECSTLAPPARGKSGEVTSHTQSAALRERMS